VKKIFIFLAFVLISVNSFADKSDSFNGWSVTVYGLSHHVTKSTSTPYREVNPGLGLRKHFGECFWKTANCFAELSYISKNSLDGKVQMASVGSKWTLAKIEGWRLHAGGTITYLEYEKPLDSVTYNGVTIIPFLGFGKGNWDFDVSVLSQKPIQSLMGKEDKTIYFAHLNYRF
jgi:hypothetical protein